MLGELLTESEHASICLQADVPLTTGPRHFRRSPRYFNEQHEYQYRSGTHDRVIRFTPVFGSNNAAANYATAQGISWIQGRMA